LKPNLIVILDCQEVSADFHARFSALQKTYQYVILNRKSPPALDSNRAWHVKESLDALTMEEAAKCLLGTHDFTSFRATLCQAKSPIRTMDSMTVRQSGEHIYFTFKARSFLHHMIRNFVGSLKLVGSGYHQPEQVKLALQLRNRSAAGPTAPACGLYLQEILY
jgi:tRNA pseudouridine38-40 synthase